MKGFESLISCLFLTSLSLAKPVQQLLALGEQIQISSPPTATLILSQKGVVQIQQTPQFILVQGQKKGRVTLTQNQQIFVFQVVEPYEKTQWNQLIQQIQKMPELEYQFKNSYIHITGKLYRWSQWQELAQISNKTKVPFLMQAQLHSQVRKNFLSFVRKTISPLPFRMEWNPVQIFAATLKPFHQFQAFGVQVKQDLSLEPLIKWHLHLVDLHANTTRSLGLQFQHKEEMPLASFSPQQWSKVLSYIQDQNKGQLISSKKLLIQSGSKGNFFIGGEVPIYDHNAQTHLSQVRFKPYGISLELQPQVQDVDTISLDLRLSVSEIDPALSKNGSIATKNHRIQTQFLMNNNQSLLLSSFTRKQEGGYHSSTPIFSLTHWVKSFLSKHQKNQEQSHSYIFLTSQIVEH